MRERLGPTLTGLEQDFIRAEAERLLGELADAATTHERRAFIGDRLAEIGDPRPGVGVDAQGLPRFVWLPVPEGTVTLEDDGGTFRVERFFISQFPVTWVQYRSFLEADDGYRDERWWKGLHQRPAGHGTQFRCKDNHPADNLSWHDAVAYCRWLSARLGFDIRLPTEQEWQQAATGGDPSGEYPWPGDWDAACANTRESGLSRTTAAGLYPAGASPVGALDMAGNVFEWCLNEYLRPKRTGTSYDEPRVVRGGSWENFHDLARAASRFCSLPAAVATVWGCVWCVRPPPGESRDTDRRVSGE